MQGKTCRQSTRLSTHRLLLIVNLSVNWQAYACVQRSTCTFFQRIHRNHHRPEDSDGVSRHKLVPISPNTSYRIPSHANPTLQIVKAQIDLAGHGLLAWSTKLIDVRPRLLHLSSLVVRWRCRSVANPVCTIHTIGTKLVATAKSLELKIERRTLRRSSTASSSTIPASSVKIRSGGC